MWFVCASSVGEYITVYRTFGDVEVNDKSLQV